MDPSWQTTLFGASLAGYQILGIPWNVFLALIPVWVAGRVLLSVKKRRWAVVPPGEKTAFVLLFLFWLFFLPNAEYLFTMVRHLANYCFRWNEFRVCEAGAWKIPFFFAYASVGIPTFYLGIERMKEAFRILFGGMVAGFLPVCVVPLCSFGVMFGLFQRFNTWSLLSDPVNLIRTTVGYFADPVMIRNFLVFTTVGYLAYYGTAYFICLTHKK